MPDVLDDGLDVLERLLGLIRCAAGHQLARRRIDADLA